MTTEQGDESVPDLTGLCRKTEPDYFAGGELADIWRGELRTANGPPVKVVLKVVRGAWSSTETVQRMQNRLLREARVWSSLRHPNITPFLGISFDAHRLNHPCLVSPYYTNRDLPFYLNKHPEADRLQIMYGIASGLEFMHRHNVIHGDIRGSNVLANDNGEPVLTDFGLSKILNTSGFTTKNVGGTCRWMAPELLQYGQDEGEIPYGLTAASDVWAFGMTVLEIYTRRLPYSHLKYDVAVIVNVIKGELPKKERNPEVDSALWPVLSACWAVHDKRPPMGSVRARLEGVLSQRRS